MQIKLFSNQLSRSRLKQHYLIKIILIFIIFIAVFTITINSASAAAATRIIGLKNPSEPHESKYPWTGNFQFYLDGPRDFDGTYKTSQTFTLTGSDDYKLISSPPGIYRVRWDSPPSSFDPKTKVSAYFRIYDKNNQMRYIFTGKTGSPSEEIIILNNDQQFLINFIFITPAPTSVDLKINSQDKIINVQPGSTLNLSWSSIDSTSCTVTTLLDGLSNTTEIHDLSALYYNYQWAGARSSSGTETINIPNSSPSVVLVHKLSCRNEQLASWQNEDYVFVRVKPVSAPNYIISGTVYYEGDQAKVKITDPGLPNARNCSFIRAPSGLGAGFISEFNDGCASKEWVFDILPNNINRFFVKAYLLDGTNSVSNVLELIESKNGIGVNAVIYYGDLTHHQEDFLYNGPINFSITGPSTNISGSTVSSYYGQKFPGTYNFTYNSGGPSNAKFARSFFGAAWGDAYDPTAANLQNSLYIPLDSELKFFPRPIGSFFLPPDNILKPAAGVVVMDFFKKVTVDIKANNNDGSINVSAGTPFNISWNSSGTPLCRRANDWATNYPSPDFIGSSYSLLTSEQRTITLNIPGTYIYKIACESILESVQDSVSVTVTAIPGDMSVKATLDGAPWSGGVNYSISGPVNLSGNTIPTLFSNKPSGSYTIIYTNGGPGGTPTITPASSQFLPGGSTIEFTLNFKSVCSDGLDNDSDGKTDYPNDKGCESATDPTETINLSCAGSPASAQPGQTVTWTAYTSSGQTPYSYSWSGTDGLSGVTQSVTKSYTTTGTKTASVTVISGSETKTVACANLIVTENSNKLLIVAKNIAPGGMVTSLPAGINCGVSCQNQSASFTSNTLVNLIATPSSGYTFSGWTNCSTQSTSPLSVTMNADKNCNANFYPLNAPPTAVAGISLNTTAFGSSINVVRGVATTFYLSSWRGTQSSPTSKSDDPNGWNHSTLGMYFSPAKCEWDTDLVKNAASFAADATRTPPRLYFYECSDPDANASNYITLTKTFNDAPGTYAYYVLKMTDKAGGVSNPLGMVQVKVLAQCEDGIDNDGDGKIDFSGANPDPECSSGGDDDETTPPPLTFPDLTASAPTPTTATSGSVLFSSTISNGGTATTGSGFINLFQISLSSDGSSPINYNTSTASSLSAGANVATSKSITLSAGTYYLRVCADSENFPGGPNPGGNGVIAESNELNNCNSGVSWTAITVTDPPIPVDGYYNGWNTCDSSCNQTAICIPPQNGGAACALPAPTQSCTGGACPTNSGSCAPEHYGCTSGASASNESHTANWTWTCTGTDNIPVSCTERKRQPGYRER